MIARRRPRRGLFMVYAAFNVGLFVVVTVITSRHVGPAVGFGLFAMLSIVRLRSEPFANTELAYFFSALVLALATAIRLEDNWVGPAGSAVVLVVLYLIDHPALYRRTARQDVTLDTVIVDPGLLRAELEDLAERGVRPRGAAASRRRQAHHPSRGARRPPRCARVHASRARDRGPARARLRH